MSVHRQPPGLPTGGQFAPSTHPEADGVDLDGPTARVDPDTGIVALRDKVEAWCRATGHGADIDDLTYYVARTGADDLASAYDAYTQAYPAATWTFKPPAAAPGAEAGPRDAARTR